VPRPQVIITDFVTGSLEPEEKILGDIADVVALNAFAESELIGKVEHAAALMLYHNLSITRAAIERLTLAAETFRSSTFPTTERRTWPTARLAWRWR
jgi:hypothetical protein